MMNLGEAFAALGHNTWISTFCPFFDWKVLRRIASGSRSACSTIIWWMVGAAVFFLVRTIRGADELERRGERVRVVDSFITGKRHNLAHLPTVELLEGDRAVPEVADAGVPPLPQHFVIGMDVRRREVPADTDARLFRGHGHGRSRSPLRHS